MNLKGVRQIRVPRQKKHRVGRGRGSGWGTTAGRGHKGAGQRSGATIRLHFEGGQMPLYRRLPKKGFNNARFSETFHVVNVGALAAAFGAGSEVDLAALKQRGLAPKRAHFVKVLGYGEIPHALRIRAHGISTGARQKIEAAGGAVEILPPVRAPRTTAPTHPPGAGRPVPNQPEPGGRSR